MPISLDSSYLSLNNATATSSKVNSDKLSGSLSNINSDSTDKELLDACKNFEQYFVEKVMKEFTSSLDEINDGEYMKYFGDTMIESYAEKVTDTGDIGIAKMLYDSMKRK